MIQSNCNGNPIIDNDLLRDTINKWANAKGVNPDHVFANAYDWSIPRYSEYRSGPSISIHRCKPTLGLLVKGRINTEVFEEAIIEE